MAKKISELGKFYDNANENIPICCHYDKETLLTKDGEFIQILQINGINQENLSMNLLGLREIIRNSLRKYVNTTDLACWIHTIRRKVNLDDETAYPSLFSQNIHDIWVRKNYWNDKYVNTLFISFVYKGAPLKLTDFNSLIASFKLKKVEEAHTQYLNEARNKLESVVTNITEELKEFGAKRLGIIVEGEEVYCEMLTLFYGILRFIESPIKIEETDLSNIIGSFGYAVGSDKIEVISEEERKYASILSIKEYQEVPDRALDRILQQPTEFVITEIFHFVPAKEAKQKIAYQDYIIRVSGDEELARQKGISLMLESESKYKIPFCYQQISLLIMNENIASLEKTLNNVSFELAKAGLVHAREDINIENAFWAQVPGNFKYLRRLNPMSVDSVASMASLHNFPAGSHTNPWGKAVTILRTERGTPYFFNFHNNENGKCLAIGNNKSGKTVLLNFLISEAIKFDPAILFITYTNDSEVFIKANYGKWDDTPFKLDPFKIDTINNNPLFIAEFLTAMTYNGDDTKPLTDPEKEALNNLIKFIQDLPLETRSFSKIGEFNFEGEAAQSLKIRMTAYLPGGEYYEAFIDDGKWENQIDQIQAINFAIYSDAAFAKVNYPSEERDLPEYRKKFHKFCQYRELILFCNLLKFADLFKEMKQIFKVENINILYTGNLSSAFYKAFFEQLSINKNIFINSVQFSPDLPFFKKELWKMMQTTFATKLYLPAETTTPQWQERLHLTDHEYAKFRSLIPATRLFIIKQDNLAIACELSLGGLPGIIKLLSAEKNLLEKCNEIIALKGEDPENWLIEFYDSLR